MSLIRTLRSVLRFRRLELDPVERRLRVAADVTDLRRLAKRRVPAGVFDYIDGGAEDEVTLRRNSQAFAELEFRPRILRDVREIDTTATILGREQPLPLVLAPTGFTRIAHPDGELAVARAARRAGVAYTLSTLGTRSIEELRQVSDGDLWFQVYVWRDRALVEELVERAREARYRVLMLTVDTAVLGRRQRDVRRGFTLPPKVGIDTLLDGALHPGWTRDLLRSEPISFANVRGRAVGDGTDAVSLSSYVNSQFDPSLSWDDVAWLRERWPGPMILKGIQTVEDARLAADAGVEGVSLSNHGGRQLDSAPVPLELLAPVVDAVGDRLEVYVDGGVRRGADLAKALALGARGCLVGRAYLYGLAAAGERGVDHVLSLFAEDLRRTLALLGCARSSDLGPELVRWRLPG